MEIKIEPNGKENQINGGGFLKVKVKNGTRNQLTCWIKNKQRN